MLLLESWTGMISPGCGIPDTSKYFLSPFLSGRTLHFNSSATRPDSAYLCCFYWKVAGLTSPSSVNPNTDSSSHHPGAFLSSRTGSFPCDCGSMDTALFFLGSCLVTHLIHSRPVGMSGQGRSAHCLCFEVVRGGMD